MRDRSGRERERTISRETEVGETQRERERAIEKERHGGREKGRNRERETGVRER